MSAIRVYKMTHATGFAPNPFDKKITLACCKPLLRNGKTVREDDWVIGIGAKSLGEDFENKIIYAMKVGKVIPWTKYYKWCQENSPSRCHEAESNTASYGDCIYKWDDTKVPQPYFTSKYENEAYINYLTNFTFVANDHHPKKTNAIHDLGGENVLIGDPEHSYFLGNKCISWETATCETHSKINQTKRAGYGIIVDDDVEKLEELFKDKGINPISDFSNEETEKRIIKSSERITERDESGSITKEEIIEELNKGKIERNGESLIVLSRKGFDTSYGRCPSIIVKKKMISFPIPEVGLKEEEQDECTFYPLYSCLKIKVNEKEEDLKSLIIRSSGNNIKKAIFNDMVLEKETKDHVHCHLDPQLHKYFDRPDDFQASLGQMDIPARLLSKYDIRPGDLFLFFGNYKFVNDDFETDKAAMNGYKDFFHCIWGFMEVGKKIVNPQLNKEDVPEYVKKHNPHMKYTSNENFLYIAAEKLSNKWCPEGYEGKLRGYGIFDYNENLILSPKQNDSPDKTRNQWKILPLYMNNTDKNVLPMRGQEFVLYPIPTTEEEKFYKNYNKLLNNIKEVLKEQAGNFKLSE